MGMDFLGVLRVGLAALRHKREGRRPTAPSRPSYASTQYVMPSISTVWRGCAQNSAWLL